MYGFASDSPPARCASHWPAHEAAADARAALDAMHSALRSLGRLLTLLVWAALLACPLAARSNEQPEYRLKAAFVYNFAAFTEWPAEVGPTLNLCIFGPDPFLAEIDSLDGKTAGARRIDVHRKATVEAVKGCQIVFVAAAVAAQLPRLLDSLRGSSVLTIADSAGAASEGVMLNMNLVQGRVTFEANLIAARQARLTLSSKLLRLATEIIQ